MRSGPTMFRATLTAALAAAVAGGCASGAPGAGKPARPGSIVSTPVEGRSSSPAAAAKARPQPKGARTVTADSPTAGTDPCAMRLHDLSGLLLMYYVTYKRLPEKLEDLAPLADDPSTFQAQITCPASGQPYVYVPRGLPGAGTDRALLVYDPTPAHGGGGYRWVILASPPQGDQPLSTWVAPYTEQKFKRHAPQ